MVFPHNDLQALHPSHAGRPAPRRICPGKHAPYLFQLRPIANLTLWQDAGTSPVDGSGSPNLAADITTSFPEADIFGVKLVNSRPTKALITISNHDTSSLNVAFVSGALLSTKPVAEDAPYWQSIVRNLTAVQYAMDVPAGETKELPFSFALDMQPQDVRVQLTAVVMNDKGEIFQVQAADEVAAVVEAPTSFFDPQMYEPTLSTNRKQELVTNEKPQHLPVPLPHRCLRRYPLLCLQDLD